MQEGVRIITWEEQKAGFSGVGGRETQGALISLRHMSWSWENRGQGGPPASRGEHTPGTWRGLRKGQGDWQVLP